MSLKQATAASGMTFIDISISLLFLKGGDVHKINVESFKSLDKMRGNYVSCSPSGF